MWTVLKTKLADWETDFEEVLKRERHEITQEDLDYISRELPLLRAEERASEKRLRKIDELIAKTYILLDDLKETICQKLSHGHSLAVVGRALLEEFGHKLDEGHTDGKDKIRRFLEKRFGINKKESNELFNLLEDVGIIVFKVDIVDNVKEKPMVLFEPPEEGGEDVDLLEPFYQMKESWEIRA